MTNARYSFIAMLLHWSIALALVFQIALGWQFETLERGANLFGLFQLHKSVGIAILVLSILRLALRYTLPRPAAFADDIWSQRAAKMVHAAFYIVMIGGPVTGWILVSTAKIGIPTMLFGAIPLPHLPIGKAFHEPAEIAHELLAWVAIGLLVLHVAGALRHQFFKGENILGRMIPWAVRRGGSVLVTLSVIFAAFGFAFWNGYTIRSALPEKTAAPVTATPAAPIATPSATDAKDGAKNTSEDLAEAAQETPVADTAAKLADWQIARGGRLGFTVDWNGTPINGSFGRWTGDIHFGKDDLARSAITVNVDLGSATTSDAQRDEMLQGDSFFNVAAHPRATFKSSSITHVGGDTYRARGTLNLNGRTQPLSLDFNLKINDQSAKVSGTSRIKRTAFGVGSGEWAATDEVADNVSVSFNFSAKAKN